MNAVAYLRVSTVEQAIEGFSLPAQERDVRSYCKAHNLELTHAYTDVMSGKSVKYRAALQELLQDAMAGQFQRVIVWKIDRFGRNLRDSINLYADLESYGVDVVSATQAFDSGTPSGRAFRNMLSLWAEFERDTIIERVKLGMMEKMRRGELVGALPIGYQRNIDGQVVADPATAPLVTEAFRRFISGDYSLLDLARWAYQAGFRTRNDNPHTKQSLHALLTTQTYLGVVARDRRDGGAIIAQGKHPPLVSEAVFQRAQQVLASRRFTAPLHPFGRRPYPLTGVATCYHCGTLFIGRAGGSGRLMRCATTDRRGKAACPQPMVKADLLEAQVTAYVATMRLFPEDMEAIEAEMRQIHRERQGKATSVDPGRLRAGIESWRQLFVAGDIEFARYQQEVVPLKARLQAAAPRRSFNARRALTYCTEMGSLWEHRTPEQRRAFVHEVFDRIVVDGSQVRTLQPKPVYRALFEGDRLARFGKDAVALSRGGQTHPFAIAPGYIPVLNPRTGFPYTVPDLAA